MFIYLNYVPKTAREGFRDWSSPLIFL